MAAKEPKLPGAVKGGIKLTIFTDEKDKTGAKAVTLKDLKLEIDGFDDDVEVQFLVKTLKAPTGRKNIWVTHAFVGEKVLPLNKKLWTLTVHGHAFGIRGWLVDFSTSDSHSSFDGTQGVKWLRRNHTVNSGTELEAFFETEDIDGLWKRARELVRDSDFAPRVRPGCAQVRCMVARREGGLRCLFDGEGANALEDAIQYAARQTICNKATYLPGMETNKWFLFLPDDLQRDAKLAMEGLRYDHATFDGHGHVTMAVPLGTRVSKNAKDEEKWEYLTASGTFRRAEDRADAEKKALRNPHIRETVRRMEELEKNLRAYDVEYGNATGGLPPECLPHFFQDRDKRDGRGFNSKMFDVDAVWKFRGLLDAYAVDATPPRRHGTSRRCRAVDTSNYSPSMLAGPLRSSTKL